MCCPVHRLCRAILLSAFLASLSSVCGWDHETEGLIQDSLSVIRQAAEARLTSTLDGVRTECRSFFAHSVRDQFVAQVEEHGVWLGNHSLKPSHLHRNDCPRLGPGVSILTQPHRHPDRIHILYYILCYNHPTAVAMLIGSLQHPNHHFLLHLDKKCQGQCHKQFAAIASEADNVELLPSERCLNIAPKGGSAVKAVLNGVEYALELMDAGQRIDWFIKLEETTVPVMSDTGIRTTLSDLAPNANLIEPIKHNIDHGWFHFEDCGGHVRRVGRLNLPQSPESAQVQPQSLNLNCKCWDIFSPLMSWYHSSVTGGGELWP